VVLDPMMRAIGRVPLGETHRLEAFLSHLPPVDGHAGAPLHAPVLMLPRVFEPELCRVLIEQHETSGGLDSGFMREVDGRTVPAFDYRHKRRTDHTIEDQTLREAVRTRINRRLAPEVMKAFQFQATRMERYLVACYDAETGGHFAAHRDNTTKGTAHRRFAVSINLNSEDYEGGDLRFPEFGTRTYRPPTGGAVVFSCSLLHEALPVTEGRRYAFLPFLYDEAAAAIREENNPHLAPEVGKYQRDPDES
jgi:predicted 2-oxoglutarate/Fe(II)-dependent dioxygenase YbiX